MVHEIVNTEVAYKPLTSAFHSPYLHDTYYGIFLTYSL